MEKTKIALWFMDAETVESLEKEKKDKNKEEWLTTDRPVNAASSIADTLIVGGYVIIVVLLRAKVIKYLIMVMVVDTVKKWREKNENLWIQEMQ